MDWDIATSKPPTFMTCFTYLIGVYPLSCQCTHLAYKKELQIWLSSTSLSLEIVLTAFQLSERTNQFPRFVQSATAWKISKRLCAYQLKDNTFESILCSLIQLQLTLTVTLICSSSGGGECTFKYHCIICLHFNWEVVACWFSQTGNEVCQSCEATGHHFEPKLSILSTR